MIRIVFITLACFIHHIAYTQTQTNTTSLSSSDSLKYFLTKKSPPVAYSLNFNHQDDRFGKKLLRGTCYSTGYNLTIVSYLLIAPERISNWDKEEKFQIKSILNQYKKSYTSPPVWDSDLWYINYVGHPYQGSFYYNTVRSQNAKVWQSALFCVGHSLLWEYGWEAGMEQPSIQDLFTTTFAGMALGELSHVATKKLSKNGFRWYEVALTCLINPAYAINNGFRFNNKKTY